ncbi:MAG: transposase [Acidobacteriota bacterium]|jgi:transposase|nr:transposase [Acidobacteriota bacterium]
MTVTRQKYDEEFKKNAVKLSYASPKGVAEIAKDLGVNANLLYRWRQRWTSGGDKTRYATLEQELRATQRELAEVRMERDMLKKAAAYFASLHK